MVKSNLATAIVLIFFPRGSPAVSSEVQRLTSGRSPNRLDWISMSLLAIKDPYKPTRKYSKAYIWTWQWKWEQSVIQQISKKWNVAKNLQIAKRKPARISMELLNCCRCSVQLVNQAMKVAGLFLEFPHITKSSDCVAFHMPKPISFFAMAAIYEKWAFYWKKYGSSYSSTGRKKGFWSFAWTSTP